MRVLTADEEIGALTLKIVPNEPPKGSQDETRSNYKGKYGRGK